MMTIEYDYGISLDGNNIMLTPPIVITYLLTLLLSGCSWLGVYTPDINQGNIITQEMVDQLKPGMTKRQAAFIMGTPLLVDPFHEDRWDYIYSTEPSGKDRMQKRITLIFDKDELAGLQGDFRPGDLPSTDQSRDITVTIPKIEREKSLWEKVSSLFGR
jgi:outer membrane protein assembly factor BamE